ncbi:MAG: CpXC domain-containing protein [Endomicrobia bacterium]|nr:CpXC domain-containing protein [Endomicrobiia bacterium]MCL2506532.1 CpXC domain-containing protein [Endomicrobiia bacterium]
MSISNLEEITCPCGNVFEAELTSAISVSDNPELKEALIAGEINLVSCPQCGEMFYAECFILYHDSENELIAFVYPLAFQNQAAQCREKMLKEFHSAIDNFTEKQKINYEPFLIFGIEDLVLILKAEQEVEDEESVLEYTASKIGIGALKISSSVARKFSIPKVLPVLKGSKTIDENSIVSALKILLKQNPSLLNYKKLLDRISKNKSLFSDVKKRLNND